MAVNIDLAILEVTTKMKGGKEMEKALAAIDKELKEAEKGTLEYAEALKKAEKIYKSTGKASDEYLKSLNEIEKANKDLADQMKKGEKSAAGFKSMFSDLGGLAQDFGGSLGPAGSSLSSFAGALGPASLGIAGLGAALQAAYSFIAPIEERFTNLRLTVERDTGLIGTALHQTTADLAALADTFGQDEKEITRGVKSMAKAFEIDFTEALDLYEKAVLAGADANGDFLSKLEEYPVQFAKSGQSAEDFIKVVTTEVKEGVFDDKLTDSVKELGLRLRELTPAAKDALNILGKGFAKDLIKDIEAGEKSISQLTIEIGKQAEKAGLSVQQLATLTADLGGGPVEDTGGLLKVVELLTKAQEVQLGVYDKLGEKQAKQLRLQKKLSAGQELLAQNFEGLSSAVGRFSSEIELTLINSLNKVLFLFQDADDRFKILSENLTANSDNVKVAIEGVGEGALDTEAGMRKAELTAEIYNNKLAALKKEAEDATFYSFRLNSSIEEQEEKVNRANLELKLMTETTAKYKAEAAKTVKIEDELNAAIDALPAEEAAAKRLKLANITKDLSLTTNDVIKKNKALAKLLKTVTKNTTEDADAQKDREKAMKEATRAAEQLLAVTEKWNDALAQSKINVDKDYFGLDTLNAQFMLDAGRLEAQAEKEIESFIKLGRKAGKAQSEIDAEVAKRRELLDNQTLLLEGRFFDAQKKQKEAGIMEYYKALDDLDKRTQEAIAAQKVLDNLIQEPEDEEADEEQKTKIKLGLLGAELTAKNAMIELSLQRGVISEKEAADQRYAILEEALKKEIALLKEREVASTEITLKEIELEKLRADRKAKNNERIQEQIGRFKDIADIGFSVLNEIESARSSKLDEQYSKQESRVERARELAEQGNSEALKLEEDRLAKIDKERAASAKRQQAYAAAEAAANMIVAITQAATTPWPANIGAIASSITAVVAGIAAVSGLFSSAPGFKDGVIGLEGPGTTTSDSIPTRLSKGESVITATGTEGAREALTLINSGKLTDADIFGVKMPNPAQISAGNYDYLAGRIDQMSDKVSAAIGKIPVSSTKVTRSGISTAVNSVQKKITKRNNRL